MIDAISQHDVMVLLLKRLTSLLRHVIDALRFVASIIFGKVQFLPPFVCVFVCPLAKRYT